MCIAVSTLNTFIYGHINFLCCYGFHRPFNLPRVSGKEAEGIFLFCFVNSLFGVEGGGWAAM